MKPRGASLAGMMGLILLVGADLAAAGFLAWLVLDFTALHHALGLLPMANILAILGFRLARHPEARRPSALGFFGFGLAAMAAQFAFGGAEVELRAARTIGSFYELCRAWKVPRTLAVSPEGYSYFRYYPAFALVVFNVPQFFAAGLGGLLVSLATRPAGDRPGTTGVGQAG